jgi:polyribonucleotide nucleotidyltransferase
MGDIKSALEIAMEKIEKLGKATDEERLKWKYVPEGEKLAVRYLKQDCNLVVELSEYEEAARKYVVAGASDILIRNINLPKDDLAKKNNRQVMDGLKNLKNTKVAVENAYSKIRRIFNHYAEQGEQQRKQAYESLKTEFEAKMQQAIQQQLGSLTRIKIDVEKQPQFQEEWRKIQTQLDSQYLKLLDEYKQELSGIA